MTSYLSENKAKNLQNGDVHPAQIADFGIGYLENHLTHFFFIFHALPFQLNFVFDQRFPLN